MKFKEKMLGMYLKESPIMPIRQGYLILLLLCLCLRYIGAYVLVPPIFDSCLFSFLAFAGVGIILFDVFKENTLAYYKKNLFLVLFIVFLGITSIVNIQYGFFQNIKFIIWTAINFFILYPHGRFQTEEARIKKMILFQNILIVFWVVMTAFSLVSYLLRISIVEEIRENTWFRLGIAEGRLFGVFVNPNSASIISLFVMLFSFFQIFFKSSSRLPKAVNILNIILQFLYIILSESRGTAMIFFISAVVLSFGISYIKLPYSTFRKICVSALISISSFVLLAALMRGIESLCEDFIKFINLFLPETTEWKTSRNILTKRVDFVENNDISNLRFKIWLSAAEIFQKKWLFGVSPGNIVTYAKDVLPNTFIATRGYIRSHSVWIGIPLYTGICGTILMFGFFLKSFVKSLKFYIEKGLKNVLSIYTLYAFIVALTWIYGLVELEILFVNSACSFVFWTSLGFVRERVDF